MTSSNAVATLPSVDGELNYLKLNGEAAHLHV
jgi:hypothetical protein